MVTRDPSDVFGTIYATQAGSNFGRWSDPRVDELADHGLKEPNMEKRKQIYHELQR
jgi:ABC-type transport system substrate-binding protein